jgi:hypothetical protein
MRWLVKAISFREWKYLGTCASLTVDLWKHFQIEVDRNSDSQKLCITTAGSMILKTMSAALPSSKSRVSKADLKRTNRSTLLYCSLVLIGITAISIHQSVVFPVNLSQYVGTTSSAFLADAPDLPSPEQETESTTTLQEKDEVPVITSSPENENASVAETISVDAAISLRGAALAPAPAPTSYLTANPDRVFWCGYTTMFGDLDYNLAKELFPGVPAQTFAKGDVEVGPNDVLLKTRSGRCKMGGKVGRNNPRIEDVFPGKIMYVVGESNGPSVKHERVYTLGPLADSGKSTRAYFGAMVLGVAKSKTQKKIFDPKSRVKNSKKKFLLYVVSNCVTSREQAFTDLSSIGTVHYGGGCSGLPGGNGTIVESRVTGGWLRNSKRVFDDYRFALVMENKRFDGYITEKIVNAFLSGTVPIWSGTREIYEVFNERAFIFYDVENPQPALDRIIYLEQNRTAYDEVLNEPILANGDKTIEDYFSFRDEVGGGKLKKRIRNMLGYQ